MVISIGKVRKSSLYEDMKAFPVLSGQPALHIPLAGVSYCDRSYHIIRKDSTVAVLEYILEGEGFVEWEGAPRHVGKDSIYFLPRGQNHSYYADGEEPFTKIFMTFCCVLICWRSFSCITFKFEDISRHLLNNGFSCYLRKGLRE